MLVAGAVQLYHPNDAPRIGAMHAYSDVWQTSSHVFSWKPIDATPTWVPHDQRDSDRSFTLTVGGDQRVIGVTRYG